MSRSGLLVSVRSAAEAEDALEGGADLIDVKEPDRGPLGRADDETIREVIAHVNGRRPVSAALGEWRDHSPGPIPSGLSFVKWGLTGWKGPLDVLRAIPECVLVAYADSERADSPPVNALVAAAVRLKFPVFLIDTAVKDGKALLDWIPESVLGGLCDRLRAGGVRVALAGSLNADSIRRLSEVRPDWFAVRGSACVGGRDGAVCADRVRELRSVIGRGD